jgi:transcriptional regulator GlxA family with amidase domain
MAPFRSIAAYAPHGVCGFGLGIVGEVFASRTRRGLPAFELSVCTDTPGQVRTDLGVTINVEHGLNRLAEVDLVILLADGTSSTQPSQALIDAIRAAHSRGAIIAAHCDGAFLLAATGLLDGARATTHWLFAAELAARYPHISVAPEVLYVDQGPVVTSAGAAAGLDLYLHLLRREHGPAVANAIAREVVVAPHRDGGQAQYISRPVPTDGDDARLTAVITWARDNLHQPLTVDTLAGRALMSPRTFARRFTAATGTTPHSWLRHLRLDHAEELLEATTMPVEEIANRVGYTSAVVLREQRQVDVPSRSRSGSSADAARGPRGPGAST